MKTSPKPLTVEQLEALRRLDACTLANAIETFHKRLRDEGFVDRSIHSLFPRLQPMVGFAATIKIRGSLPPHGWRHLSRPDGLVGLHPLPARAARGCGGGLRHSAGGGFLAGGGSHQYRADT